MINLPFGLPLNGPKSHHQKLVRHWGLDTDHPKEPEKSRQQKIIKNNHAKPTTQQQNTEKNTMTINKAVENMRAVQEKTIKAMDDAANSKIPGLIANMKNANDAIVVNDLIRDCEGILQNCMNNLTHGGLSNEYKHNQNMAQQQQIKDINHALNNQAHNLFKTADSKGFAFLG